MPSPNEDVSAVQRSQEFYRLKETIDSQGAIFELNESSKAMYIGPDSDIAEVQVTYYNPDADNQLETAIVSVNGPLVGRLDSLPQTQVSSTQQPARILVSPADTVKPDYDPGAVFSAVLKATRTFRVPTKIDFMVALKPLPAIPEVRADRTIRLPRVPFAIGDSFPVDEDGSTTVIVPIYGRRMVTVTGLLTARTTGGLSIRGVNMSAALVSLTPGSSNPAPRWVSNEDQAGSSIFVPAQSGTQQPQSRTVVIRASDASRAGTTFDETGEITGFYFESDAPPPQQFLGTFLGGPRGMADLLVINIKQNPTDPAAASDGLGYIDLFVKLADRET